MTVQTTEVKHKTRFHQQVYFISPDDSEAIYIFKSGWSHPPMYHVIYESATEGAEHALMSEEEIQKKHPLLNFGEWMFYCNEDPKGKQQCPTNLSVPNPSNS